MSGTSIIAKISMSLRGSLANSVDPDQMPCNVVFRNRQFRFRFIYNRSEIRPVTLLV